VSAFRAGISALEIAFGEGTVVLIRCDSTDQTPVSNWPPGLPLLIVSATDSA
jgi:hypothetical protein